MFAAHRLIAVPPLSAKLLGLMRHVMRFTDVVQHLWKSPVIARLIQEMGGAEGKRRFFIFRQIVVGQHDDLRPPLRARQRSHHTESRPLLQMQIQNDHVHRFAPDVLDRRGFRIGDTDQVNIVDLG
jgi:hypothetical protein